MSKTPDAPPPANLDTSADKKGKTVDVEPENKKRLLELEGELERHTGPGREALQEEIERLRKGPKTSV